MNKEIFKAYDIRGIFNKSLTLDDVELIGYGLSKILKKHNQENISVGDLKGAVDFRKMNTGPDYFRTIFKRELVFK